MSEALKELASSSALGATLVVLLFLLSWLVKVLVASFVRQTESVTKAMTELVEASRAIRDNCRSCRTDSLSTLRDAQAAIELKIEHTVYAARDLSARENEKLIGDATEDMDRKLTDTANSIRAGNAALVQDIENQRLRHENEELSRPHNADTSGVVRR